MDNRSSADIELARLLSDPRSIARTSEVNEAEWSPEKVDRFRWALRIATRHAPEGGGPGGFADLEEGLLTIVQRLLEERATGGPDGGSSPVTGAAWERVPSLAEYREHLIGQGLASNTVRTYLTFIVRAAEGLADLGWRIVDAPASAVAEYSRTLPRSRSSRMITRVALGHYWELAGRRKPPTEAVRVPPKPRFSPKALSEDDAEALLEGAWDRDDAAGLAVLLGLHVGLRAAEIASLRWDEISEDGWVIITGKGDVIRTLPLHPYVLEALERWRTFDPAKSTSKLRTRPGETYVFDSRSHRAYVNPTTVLYWVKQVGEDVGIDRDQLWTHRLRHTFLTEINDRTGDLRTAQELAGHADPAETARYTRVNDTKKVAAVMAIEFRRRDHGAGPTLDEVERWAAHTGQDAEDGR